MRGVEILLAQGRGVLGRHPVGLEELEGLGDSVGDFAKAGALGAALDEAEGPAVDAVEIGISALREGAQQVERRRRPAVGLKHAPGVGFAGLHRKRHVVDDVAAIGRQLDAIAHLDRR